MKRYTAVYNDKNGLVKTRLENYGGQLQITINGVNFEGEAFNKLKPEVDTPRDLLVPFTFRNQYLSDFTLFYNRDINIHNVFTEKTKEEVVEIKVIIGKKKQLTISNMVYIALFLDDELYRTKISNERFGHAFRDLYDLLPTQYQFESCKGCELVTPSELYDATYITDKQTIMHDMICEKIDPVL